MNEWETSVVGIWRPGSWVLRLTETSSSQAVCVLLEPGEECRLVQGPLSSTHKNIQRQDKPVAGVTGWER